MRLPQTRSADGLDGRVELDWGAVTDATRYVILWDNNVGPATFENEITGLEGTSYTHTGLENLRRYRYKIVAETSGGRGPESTGVSAVPGPVPGRVEWTVVTAQNPGHTIYFPTAPGANGYRIYFWRTSNRNSRSAGPTSRSSKRTRRPTCGKTSR